MLQPSLINRALGLVLLVAWVFLQVACSGGTAQDYAKRLNNNLTGYDEQKVTALRAYEEARKQTAQITAQPQLKFSEPTTQEFICQISTADKELKKLRQRFNQVNDSAQAFFDYCDAKAKKIDDADLCAEMITVVYRTREKFVEAADKTDKAIIPFEEVILYGQDIISSLEIVDALSIVKEKRQKLENLHKMTVEKLPDLDLLRIEGLKLIKSKLKDL